MNLVELDHALRKLRLSGMAVVLETRLRQAQSEKLTPIDLVSRLVSDELLRRHPTTRRIPAGANVGFAAGCRLGAEAARARDLLFVNDDAVVEPEALERLVETLDRSDGDVVAVAGRLWERLRGSRVTAAAFLPAVPDWLNAALARIFGVSRVVVRQALAILEDDRQIIRVKGRGTFVAEPKIDYRAGGLSRLLGTPRDAAVTVQVLDTRAAGVERSIQAALEAGEEEILRVTTLLSLRGLPLAISYSFFRRSEVGWLEAAAQVGRRFPEGLTLAEHGIELAHSEISIETSQCGQFEADRFGIPHRSPVFLVLCTEHCWADGGTRPFEVARVEYRGDMLQFRLEVSPAPARELAAIWTLTEGSGVSPQPGE